MADSKHSPLRKTTPYVGSATNRVVHKTDTDCPEVRDIPPDERWYIKDIPHDGNYILCAFCFPQRDADGNLLESDGEESGGSKKISYRTVDEAVSSLSVRVKSRRGRKKASDSSAKPDQASSGTRVKPAVKTKRAAAKKTVSAKKASSKKTVGSSRSKTRHTEARSDRLGQAKTRKAVKKTSAKASVKRVKSSVKAGKTARKGSS